MRRSHIHPSYQIYQSEAPRLINPRGFFNLLIFALLNHSKIVSRLKSDKTQLISYFQETQNDA